MTYSFKAQFVPLIESGKKLSTIRAPRKDGKLPKAGEVLTLATGMRTKHYRRIAQRTCRRVVPIRIWREGETGRIALNGITLSGAGMNLVAWKDGFGHWTELITFFSAVHALPFSGYLIEWKYEQAKV